MSKILKLPNRPQGLPVRSEEDWAGPSYSEVWRRMMHLAEENGRLTAQNQMLERKLELTNPLRPARKWWQVWR